jgi:hypothetical protein
MEGRRIEMPRSWSSKDERQYEHVKESELERGHDEDRAKEIAARTVNKQRAQEGRTKERQEGRATRSTPGKQARVGDPKASELASHTRDELYEQAKRLGVKGRSRMNKSQLVAAVQRAR